MGEMTWEEKKSAFLYDLIKDCKTAEEAVKVFIENKLIDEENV